MLQRISGPRACPQFAQVIEGPTLPQAATGYEDNVPTLSARDPGT